MTYFDDAELAIRKGYCLVETHYKFALWRRRRKPARVYHLENLDGSEVEAVRPGTSLQDVRSWLLAQPNK